VAGDCGGWWIGAQAVNVFVVVVFCYVFVNVRVFGVANN
jgi:hypothetical protein